MSVTTLLRPPLVWLVLAEAGLIAVAGGVSWHVWQERLAPSGAPVASGPPAATPRARPGIVPAPAATPAGPATSATPRPTGAPTTGLRTDSAFLAREMAELNRVESAFEDVEWRVTRVVVDGIQRYLQDVVLPSVERSQRGQR